MPGKCSVNSVLNANMFFDYSDQKNELYNEGVFVVSCVPKSKQKIKLIN